MWQCDFSGFLRAWTRIITKQNISNRCRAFGIIRPFLTQCFALYRLLSSKSTLMIYDIYLLPRQRLCVKKRALHNLMFSNDIEDS